MKTAITLTLAASALLAAAAPAALHAQSIGVNFGSGSASTTLLPTASAGAPGFAQTNYNNNNGANANDLALQDSTGSATTATLTLTGDGVTSLVSFSPAGADEILNNGFAKGFGGDTLTFSLANIPYAAYSLVVYDLSGTGTTQQVTNGLVSFFTLSPDSTSVGYVDQNPNTPFTYTQGTSLLAAAPTANADYVVFPLLTGASQTFTVTNISGGFTSVAGFQIVNAVPEPSTYALALLGGASLLGAVRRSRRLA